jgi:hypothetical protein
MSLRYFHICFILLSAALCAGVAWWNVENQGTAGMTYGFGAIAALLPIYGVRFMKRSKSLV